MPFMPEFNSEGKGQNCSSEQQDEFPEIVESANMHNLLAPISRNGQLLDTFKASSIDQYSSQIDPVKYKEQSLRGSIINPKDFRLGQSIEKQRFPSFCTLPGQSVMMKEEVGSQDGVTDEFLTDKKSVKWQTAAASLKISL